MQFQNFFLIEKVINYIKSYNINVNGILFNHEGETRFNICNEKITRIANFWK